MRIALSDRIREAFTRANLDARHPTLRHIWATIASGSIDTEDLRDLRTKADAEAALADALLVFVEHSTRDRGLTREEVDDARLLARVFRLDGMDVLRHRRDRVSALLQRELRQMLDDRTITEQEASYQSALQAALDLGYDDFLAVTKDAYDTVVNEWIAAIRESGLAEAERGPLIERKVAALRTVYAINDEQRRALHVRTT